jgi:plastocyanin
MRTLRTVSIILGAVALITACTAAKPGWTYAPAPSPTPLPSASASGSVAPSASASAEPSAPASPSASASAGGGTVLEIVALNIQFDTTEESVPADTPFQIHFVNNDPNIPHNVAIRDAAGASVYEGEIFNGVAERTYDVPALAAGEYTFICTVHPNMTGTLTAE